MEQCLWFSFVIISILNHIEINDGQTCLTSPTEITWTPSPTSTFSATITFDQATKTWNNGAIELVTRLYNGSLPGPTLRMQRGNKYEVNFVNNLPTERAENALLTGNQERDPNTANLHTHGLHISGLPNADDVLTAVPPQTNKLYTYNIPCHHSGGIHWYHSHHHPSVQLHVGGGAAGVIYIEDDASLEGLPSWYTGMKELIFWITHIDHSFITNGYPPRTQDQRDNENILSLTPNNQDLYLVNGQYQPTVCQQNGEWIKYRFGQTEIWQPQRYQIGNSGDCTLQLLARDGVIVNNPPRSVGNIVWLAESSRADVAITCNAGTHSITELNSNMVIAYINSGGAASTTLTSFTPIRPNYLTDLTSATVTNSLNLELRGDTVIVGGSQQSFDENNPYFNGVNSITIGSVNEWTLIKDNGGCCGGVFHPFHIHVNHFQVIQGPNGQLPGTDQPPLPETGYQEAGDWLDTYWGAGTIRFKPYIWGGPLVVHCHKLEHEVRGSMGALLVNNGCDYDYTDYNGGTCNNPCPSTNAPTTKAPTTTTPTTKQPTTTAPTTQAPTTKEPTTKAPTTQAPTTKEPTTKSPTTQAPTTKEPTTKSPTTKVPTTKSPTTQTPTTTSPTTKTPTTKSPTTKSSTTTAPTTKAPTTKSPTTTAPTTKEPTTQAPTTQAPTTKQPTTQAPTSTASTTTAPTTKSPTTQSPTTKTPTTKTPTTKEPTTTEPTTKAPTTKAPTTKEPTTKSPTTTAPTTKSPTTKSPTTTEPTTKEPTTKSPTTKTPTTQTPTTKSPTTASPTVASPSCLPDGTQNCSEDSDCCDNWCDNSTAGAPSKCKIPRGNGNGTGGKGTGGKAAAGQSVSDSDGSASSSTKMSGATTGVVITCAILFGLFIICGFIICFKRKYAKQKQELPTALEMVEKNESSSNALPTTSTNQVIGKEGDNELV